MNNQSSTRGVSPLAAGLTGMILGIAGTIAVAFAEENTRKKVTQKATKLKKDLLKWSDQTITELAQRSYQVRKDWSGKLDPEKKEEKTSVLPDEKLNDTEGDLHAEDLMHN